jgi:hypothetical protein
MPTPKSTTEKFQSIWRDPDPPGGFTERTVSSIHHVQYNKLTVCRVQYSTTTDSNQILGQDEPNSVNTCLAVNAKTIDNTCVNLLLQYNYSTSQYHNCKYCAVEDYHNMNTVKLLLFWIL